jgi:hypothetical protein
MVMGSKQSFVCSQERSKTKSQRETKMPSPAPLSPVESCMKEYSIAFLIDLSFNICHLLYFGLRVRQLANRTHTK